MAEIENSKDLISVLWSGADILRSKMDANEYKDYLLGIVFYKYLSDSFPGFPFPRNAHVPFFRRLCSPNTASILGTKVEKLAAFESISKFPL